jgi:hypothetical protein
MGALSHLNISHYIEKFNLKIFIETGTHRGNGVKEALKHDFEEIYSIEICETQFNIVKEELEKDKRVKIINANSLNGLKTIFKNIDHNKNILYWLDAHFPSADFGIKPYFTEDPNKIRLPLEEELLFIKNNRNYKKDVILMDDMWIYKNNGRDCPRPELRPNEFFSSDNFFEEIFKETHDAFILNDHEGYCILTPNE